MSWIACTPDPGGLIRVRRCLGRPMRAWTRLASPYSPAEMARRDTGLVSVVVCTYNQASTITRAVESALAQDYRPIEILVVDNGSTDATAAMLAAYAAHPDVRVVRHAENDAVTKRLNAAIGEARGDFVSLLYGDDTYLPGKLRMQVAAFGGLDESYGVVYTPGRRHNDITAREWESETLRVSGSILLELLEATKRGRFINPISPMVRRSCFLRHPFYEDMFVEGEAHYLRVATTHRFLFLPTATVVMHEHRSNIGKAIRTNGEGTVVLLHRLAASPELPEGAPAAIRSAIAHLHRKLGWQAIRVLEDPVWARAQFGAAIRQDPLESLRPKTLVGTALSLLPGRALAGVNRVAYSIRPPREFVAHRKGYT